MTNEDRSRINSLKDSVDQYVAEKVDKTGFRNHPKFIESVAQNEKLHDALWVKVNAENSTLMERLEHKVVERVFSHWFMNLAILLTIINLALVAGGTIYGSYQVASIEKTSSEAKSQINAAVLEVGSQLDVFNGEVEGALLKVQKMQQTLEDAYIYHEVTTAKYNDLVNETNLAVAKTKEHIERSQREVLNAKERAIKNITRIQKNYKLELSRKTDAFVQPKVTTGVNAASDINIGKEPKPEENSGSEQEGFAPLTPELTSSTSENATTENSEPIASHDNLESRRGDSMSTKSDDEAANADKNKEYITTRALEEQEGFKATKLGFILLIILGLIIATAGIYSLNKQRDFSKV